MNIKFNEESAKRMVKDYYKKHYDFDCDLNISKKLNGDTCVGRFFITRPVEQLVFTLNGKLDVNGVCESVSTEINEDEVKVAIETVLRESDYFVDGVMLDQDNNVEIAKFRGVIATMSPNRKVKVKENGD